ncbi:MAG: hypothetical protein ACI35O_14490, partial [Bacillaceae bacterium]
MWESISYIAPKQNYNGFQDEQDYEQRCKEWGLGGKNIKREFTYKSKDGEKSTTVTIDGYEVHGSHQTLVIRFLNDKLSCIHPAYLKEMQKSDFGKENMFESVNDKTPATKKEVAPTKKATKVEKTEESVSKAIVLPTDKVSFEATVKELTTRYNHFADKEEEIIIYENVRYGEDQINIGNAYSSVTKALAALELTPGTLISFDAKVVGNKKLNKDVIYKINNPSKIS